MTKLTRYNLGEIYRTYSSDKHNVVCTAYDVEKLEAKCAELLEALEWLVKIQSIVSISEAMHSPAYQRAVEQARAAIAKAKGKSNE